MAVKKADETELSDEEEKGNSEAMKRLATFDNYSLNEDGILADLYAQAENEAKKKKEQRNSQAVSLGLLKQLPNYLVHSVDFTKFKSKAVYQYAVDVLCPHSEVSGIQNPTLMQQLKAAVVAHKKKGPFEVSIALCQAMTIEQLESLRVTAPDANLLGTLFSKRFCENFSPDNIASMNSV